MDNPSQLVKSAGLQNKFFLRLENIRKARQTYAWVQNFLGDLELMTSLS